MTILCEPGADAAARLAAYLGDDVRLVASLRAAERALADRATDLVVIGGGVRLENALKFAAKLGREPGGPDVILLRDWLSAELITHALDCGVHAVLPATDHRALADARRRVVESRRAPIVAEPEVPARGAILAVLAAKGGCGKTTLAINLALALNANGSRRVCLFDLDLDSGDVAKALRIEPRRTLADASGAEALNRASVAGLVTPLGPALDCVLAPAGPGEAERVSPQLVTEVLAALPQHYDYVVVDTAATRLPGHVLAALDAADRHLLVTVPEVPALRSLRETLDVLDLLGYHRDARSIVVNRTDPQVVLSVRDVEKLLHAPVAGHVPFSWDVPASINRGVPITVAQPDHPVSKAIRNLGRTRFTPDRTGTRPAAPRRTVRGWSA